MKAYFVSLRSSSGDTLAGSNFLARDTAHARQIGEAELAHVPSAAELGGDAMAERLAASISAKLAAGYVVHVRPSNVAPRNCSNYNKEESK